jgi:hypothetical protein
MNSELLELQFKKQLLEQLLPLFSERNQARVRADLAVLDSQIKVLQTIASEPEEPLQKPTPRKAA